MGLGLEFKVLGCLGFMVLGLEFKALGCLGFMVLGFRFKGLGCLGFGFGGQDFNPVPLSHACLQQGLQQDSPIGSRQHVHRSLQT